VARRDGSWAAAASREGDVLAPGVIVHAGSGCIESHAARVVSEKIS